MTPKKYRVHFNGCVDVEAGDEAEAKSKAYDACGSSDEVSGFLVTSIGEAVCVECGGTGIISTDESDGEGHTMRGVGTQKCLCQLNDSME